MSHPVTAARAAAAALLVPGVALLAACGSSGGNANAGGGTATVTVTASPSASSDTPTASPTTDGGGSGAAPGCATSVLKVTIGQSNGTAGSVIVPVQFTNTSAASCTLYGYPGVSFVTGKGGGQIGASAGLDPTFPRQLVTLAPNAMAYAALQVTVAQNFPPAKCKMVKAQLLKVYPPGQRASLYVSYSADTCSSKSNAVRVLHVQVVRPGSGNP